MFLGGLGLGPSIFRGSPGLKAGKPSGTLAQQFLGSPQFGGDSFMPIRKEGCNRPMPRPNFFRRLLRMIIRLATVGGRFSLNPSPFPNPRPRPFI